MNDGRQNPIMNCCDAMTAHGFSKTSQGFFSFLVSWQVDRQTGRRVALLVGRLVGSSPGGCEGYERLRTQLNLEDPKTLETSKKRSSAPSNNKKSSGSRAGKGHLGKSGRARPG